MNGQLSLFDEDTPQPLDLLGGVETQSKIQLFNGDCQEILKNIPDKSIDLVVTDPPYEFDSDGGGGAFGSKNEKYHNELKEANITRGFDENILAELIRVMKKVNIYIWCNKKQIHKYLDYFEKYNVTILTWHKSNPVPMCSNKYLSDTEYCLHFRETGVKIYGNFKTKFTYWITPLNQKEKKLYGHPTIKPLNIIENLIINSSNENDTVLDCFMGSGTTGVACKKLNRNFIGIEISKEYFEIAKKRINEDL